MDRQIEQKVKTLYGELDKGNQAFRLRYVQQFLSNVPAAPTAQPVAGAPTADQYNTLLKDVRTVYEALNALRSTLAGERLL